MPAAKVLGVELQSRIACQDSGPFDGCTQFAAESVENGNRVRSSGWIDEERACLIDSDGSRIGTSVGSDLAVRAKRSRQCRYAISEVPVQVDICVPASLPGKDI